MGAKDVLLYTDDAFVHHDTGPGHPERPERLGALVAGVEASVASVEWRSPVPVATVDLERIHDQAYVERIERLCLSGGGELDLDTIVGVDSWRAAVLAAGCGAVAVEALRRGDGDLAVCVVRPPGHHARHAQAMGFCLFNNAAVAAALLASQGERVAIVDWDVHHGNGTQESFFQSPDVFYFSIHEWGPQPGAPGVSFYPGTGWLDEVGAGPGRGTTINVPVPPATVGDAYHLAFEEVLTPALARFSPSWLIVSAGFDAHRDDPLGHIGLTDNDFGAMASALPGGLPTIVFSEGGYDLGALERSMSATMDGFAAKAKVSPPSLLRSPETAFHLIDQAAAAARSSGALA